MEIALSSPEPKPEFAQLALDTWSRAIEGGGDFGRGMTRCGQLPKPADILLGPSMTVPAGHG
jgi:hypothetical protein